MNHRTLLPLLLALALLPACQSGSSGGDDDTDTGTDSDSDSDSDTDTDSDEDSDTGASCPADVAWYDEQSGLCWQNPPSSESMSLQDATDYCDDLVLEGTEDWHVPLIQELCSLSRGCLLDECDAADPNCLSLACVWGDPDCQPLDEELWYEGAGQEGYYLDPELEVPGQYDYWWSSSPVPDDGYEGEYWQVEFGACMLYPAPSDSLSFVRCVRGLGS